MTGTMLGVLLENYHSNTGPLSRAIIASRSPTANAAGN